jgi:hypothetical protein
MMLGSATCKLHRGDWNTCALGAAANAVGIVSENRYTPNRWLAIYAKWPWLAQFPKKPSYPHSVKDHWGQYCDWGKKIAHVFDYEVCTGQTTFERLVDWVKSVEPQCGECNRFECACEKTEAGTRGQEEINETECLHQQT